MQYAKKVKSVGQALEHVEQASSSLVLIAIRIVLGVHSVDPVVFPCLLGSSDLAKNVSGSAEGVRVALRSCHATPTNGYVKKDV